MKYAPLKFHVVYILVTLLFSFYGPREYVGYDKLPTFIFMMFYLIAVAVGYHLGCNSKVEVRVRCEQNAFDFKKITSLYRFSLYFSILILCIGLLYQYSQGRLNLNITEIGNNYVDFYKYYYEKKENALITFELLFLVIGALPKFIALTIGFFYYKELKKYRFYFLIFLMLIVMAQTISSGNQKSISDIFIIGAVAASLKMYQLEARKRLIIIRRIVLAMVIMFALFSYAQYGRLSARDITVFDINSHLSEFNYYNLDHMLFKVLGYEIGLGVSIFVTGYLSGGYYGLSLCLGMPFEWTYGIGNSVALSSIVGLLTDFNAYESTYLYRMEEYTGISGTRSWHTIFPWLASDITFYAIPVLFVYIGYYYGKSWKEVVLHRNPVSFMLFSLLTIMFVFVVANNQIMHGYDTVLITATVVLAYVVFRRRFNFR